MADPNKPGSGDDQREEPDAPVTDEDGRPIQPQDAPRRDDEGSDVAGILDAVTPLKLGR